MMERLPPEAGNAALPSGARIPCGHDEDALRLNATLNDFVYCARCERGYDAFLVSA